MGKKRRLKSAKAKFNAKHSSHPRMRLLAKDTEDTTPEKITTIVENTPEVIKATQAPAEPPTLTTASIPKTEKTKKTTVRKKAATSSRKRTTKKSTTGAST